MRGLARLALALAWIEAALAAPAGQDECPWQRLDLEEMRLPADAEAKTVGHSMHEYSLTLPSTSFTKICVQLVELGHEEQLPVARSVPVGSVLLQVDAALDASGRPSFQLPLSKVELPSEGSDFAASHATASLSVGMASLQAAGQYRIAMGWSTAERSTDATPLTRAQALQAHWARRAALHGAHDVAVITYCRDVERGWLVNWVALRSFLALPLPGSAKGAMVPWDSWSYVSRHHLEAAKAIVSAPGGAAGWLRSNEASRNALERQLDAEKVAASACEAAITASGDVAGADAWREGRRRGNCPAPVPALLAALAVERESMLPVLCSGGRAGPLIPRPEADPTSWWAARMPVVEFNAELAAAAGRDDACSRVAVLVGPTAGGFLDATAANWPGAWAVVAVGAWAGTSGSKLASPLSQADDLAFAMTQTAASQYGPRARVWREEPAQAAAQVPDQSVDFVVLSLVSRDYESTLRGMQAWWPKLRPGGLLAGSSFADVLDYPDVNISSSVADDGEIEFKAVQSAVTDFAKHHGRQVGQTFGDPMPWWFMRR